jgi:hypothetical protein
VWRRRPEPPPEPVLDRATLNGIIEMIMRIDANVELLVERADEDDAEED